MQNNQLHSFKFKLDIHYAGSILAYKEALLWKYCEIYPEHMFDYIATHPKH